jgi:hypothetical protein
MNCGVPSAKHKTGPNATAVIASPVWIDSSLHKQPVVERSVLGATG